MKTLICFSRHGGSKWDEKMNYQLSDAPLTRNGAKRVKQLELAIRKKAPDIRWDLIVCSNLKRSKQSADLLGKAFHAPVLEIQEFRELDNHLSKKRLRRDRTLVPEEMEPFCQRVVSKFYDVLKEHEGKNIIFITHLQVLSAISREVMHFENVGWELASGRLMQFENKNYDQTICKVK